MIPANVIDKALYARVKAEARRKFKVYPSAYANAWLVREYKKRGGRYRGPKPRSNPVVYHGSPVKFLMQEARPTQAGFFGPGVYFTTDKEKAAVFGGGFGHRTCFVYTCKVELKNPIYHHEIFDSTPEELFGLVPIDPAKQELRTLLQSKSPSALRRLVELGYDGIIVDFDKALGEPDQNRKYYIVFDPSKLQCSTEEMTLQQNPIAYHGTPVLFLGAPRVHDGAFGPGFYLTTSRIEAEDYARKPRHYQQDEDRGIYECRVELKNPIRYRDVFHQSREETYSEFLKHAMPFEQAQAIRDIINSEYFGADSSVSGPKKAAQLMALGYDGIVVDFFSADPREAHTWFVVFDPSSLDCYRMLYRPTENLPIPRLKPNPGLKKWFGEKWVDLSRPLPGGGWAECGRASAKGPDWRKKYPKCVPLAKAKRMSPEQRRSAVARKRRAMSQARAGKPTNVATYKKNPEKTGLDALTLLMVGAAAVGAAYLIREFVQKPIDSR